jgi:NAD-dependent DNA ligase
MSDNSLNQAEIEYLYHFLLEFSDLLHDWPHSFLLAKINSILEDGVITKEEVKSFEETIRSFLGGTLQETGAVCGLSTTLPLDKTFSVLFSEKSFCFTGQFKFGTRTECQNIVSQKGGIIKNSIVRDLDYLVIGELASRDWIETNYGRKIQKAMDLKRSGQSKISIIGESDLIKAFNS